jgi:hypothetical protein
VLASSFEVEILPPASSCEARLDFAEGGNGAEGAAASPTDAWSCWSSLFVPCVCSLRPPRPKHFHRHIIKLRFLSSCFMRHDLFIGSRTTCPSESYFSWKVTSGVSVSRRHRSPSAWSALPLTCTLVIFRIPLSIQKSKARKVVLVENFSEENFDAEGVPPF